MSEAQLILLEVLVELTYQIDQMNAGLPQDWKMEMLNKLRVLKEELQKQNERQEGKTS